MNPQIRTADLAEALIHGREIGEEIAKFVPPQYLGTFIERIKSHIPNVSTDDSRSLLNMLDKGLLEGLSSHRSKRGDDI